MDSLLLIGQRYQNACSSHERYVTGKLAIYASFIEMSQLKRAHGRCLRGISSGRNGYFASGVVVIINQADDVLSWLRIQLDSVLK